MSQSVLSEVKERIFEETSRWCRVETILVFREYLYDLPGKRTIRIQYNRELQKDFLFGGRNFRIIHRRGGRERAHLDLRKLPPHLSGVVLILEEECGSRAYIILIEDALRQFPRGILPIAKNAQSRWFDGCAIENGGSRKLIN